MKDSDTETLTREQDPVDHTEKEKGQAEAGHTLSGHRAPRSPGQDAAAERRGRAVTEVTGPSLAGGHTGRAGDTQAPVLDAT